MEIIEIHLFADEEIDKLFSPKSSKLSPTFFNPSNKGGNIT